MSDDATAPGRPTRRRAFQLLAGLGIGTATFQRWQAEQADREIAAGRYRGPLHGIPWGAKDLIAYPGYKTTWGAGHYKEQSLGTKATVAKRLEEAGAVLV